MMKLGLFLFWVAVLVSFQDAEQVVVQAASLQAEDQEQRRAVSGLCCDPATMPRRNAKCCGNGLWVVKQTNSNGERVYTCDSTEATGPDFPTPPFFKPCQPNECSDLTEKRACRLFYRHGCRWLRDDGKCVDLDDVSCSDLSSSRKNCRSLGKCKFKDQTCQPRCRERAADTVCTKEYFPVGCGGAQCDFGNMCEARSAGYNEKRCRRFCVDGTECAQGDVCYRRKYCSDYSTCPQGRCLTPTGNECDGFLGVNCPEGEKCISNPCPPGVQDSCGGFCIQK